MTRPGAFSVVDDLLRPYVRFWYAKVRITLAVLHVLRQFVGDASEPRYGYDLMQATKYRAGSSTRSSPDCTLPAGWTRPPRRSIPPPRARADHLPPQPRRRRARPAGARPPQRPAVTSAEGYPADAGRGRPVVLVLGALAVFAATAIGSIIWNAFGDMAKDEARTRIGQIPDAILRLALARVPTDRREDAAGEWDSELRFIVAETDGRRSPACGGASATRPA